MKFLNQPHLFRTLILGVFCIEIYLLWQNIATAGSVPIFWILYLCLALLLVARECLPSYLVVWWSLGFGTIFWSLSPADSFIATMWDLLFVAAFATGSFLPGYALLCISLVASGLFTNLALSAFGSPQYFSGSSFYTYGALALTLIPVFGWAVLRSKQWQLSSIIGLVAVLLLALMSGSRGVYLSLLVTGVLFIWRLFRDKISAKAVFSGLLTVSVLLAGLDLLIPFHPIKAALVEKGSISKQTKDSSADGSFGSRKEMWTQTLHMAQKNPFGTGNGTFRNVIAAYQQYPTVSFASAHNYYLETAATGGWLRLIALLALVGGTLWRGWRAAAWPWALGSLGLWITLGFDITSMYPGTMALAFASLGVVHYQTEKNIKVPMFVSQKFLSGLVVLIGFGLVAWWYWPCQTDCSVGRHFGYRPEVLLEAEKLSGPEKSVFLKRATLLNPKSLWVYRAQLASAQTVPERLSVLNQIVQIFPYGNQRFYWEKAILEVESGVRLEAITTLELGLARFPVDRVPAGVPFGDGIYKAYKEWTVNAPALLARLKSQ